MYHLTRQELLNLRFQFGTSSLHGGHPYCLALSASLSAQESALHARPVIQAASADFDIREDSGCLPVAQSPAADWQSRQQLFFAYETSLACRSLVMFGADATVPHVLAARRHDAQKIFRFTIHAKKTLCEAATGDACHTHRISRAGDMLPKCKVSSQSLQSHRRSRQSVLT